MYRGAWAYGQRHGEGRSERRDGSSYEGQWAHGRPLGRGTLLEPGAGRRYVGGVFRGRILALALALTLTLTLTLILTRYVGGVAGGARSGLGTLRLVGAGARYDEVEGG